jgi:hypothetical protein
VSHRLLFLYYNKKEEYGGCNKSQKTDLPSITTHKINENNCQENRLDVEAGTQLCRVEYLPSVPIWQDAIATMPTLHKNP